MVVLCLDTDNKIKSFTLVTMGLVNRSYAHAREVFRPAIASAATVVIVAHNHPAGKCAFSFLLVTDESHLSPREKGLI